jgi:integrase
MSKTPIKQPSEDEISSKPSLNTLNHIQLDESEHETRSSGQDIVVPNNIAGSGSLDRLVKTARDYASKATANNTNLAYKKDWAHFASWCRRRGGYEPLSGNPSDAEPLSGPDPQLIGLYITECAAPQDGSPPLSVSTIERKLSGLSWNYKQRGLVLDRQDRHIATVLAGIRREHAKPPAQKEAISAEDIIDMMSILPFDLRGMRDKAILLIGYAGGLRRSEVVGLDIAKDQTDDSGGWIEILDDGAVLFIKGKTGWREVEIGKGSTTATCPLHALEQWLYYSKISHGPIFRPVTRDHSRVTADRISDKHVSRLIKKCVLEAGIRTDLPEKERLALYSGHSLRSGLASFAEVDERYVQKQLGHVSAEMTRRYQRRRDRFRVNLTKAVGL